jgi:hypothetical protein
MLNSAAQFDSFQHFFIGQLVFNSQKSWNFSLRSKEDVEALLLKKQEANIKRERMMKYSFSNRVTYLKFPFQLHSL